MPTCAHCTVFACREEARGDLPGNCPMHDPEEMREILKKYEDPGTKRFFRASSAIEAEGYCRWPRLRETAEFCRRMQYRKIGVAFCIGLRREARVVVDVLRGFGLEVPSVVCKTGGHAKSDAGITPGEYVRPGTFETMCNPIAQAELLNREQVEFNILVGLCVGHDSLFLKHALAPATVLIAKDRVLAHNPAGAVYCSQSYFKEILKSKQVNE